MKSSMRKRRGRTMRHWVYQSFTLCSSIKRYSILDYLTTKKILVISSKVLQRISMRFHNLLSDSTNMDIKCKTYPEILQIKGEIQMVHQVIYKKDHRIKLFKKVFLVVFQKMLNLLLSSCFKIQTLMFINKVRLF